VPAPAARPLTPAQHQPHCQDQQAEHGHPIPDQDTVGDVRHDPELGETEYPLRAVDGLAVVPRAPRTTSGRDCHSSYVPCVPESTRDLDCKGVGHRVTVVGPDEYRLDGDDNDGKGCLPSRPAPRESRTPARAGAEMIATLIACGR
jgi:hypothetical protein